MVKRSDSDRKESKCEGKFQANFADYREMWLRRIEWALLI